MSPEIEKCLQICLNGLNGRAADGEDLLVLGIFERLGKEPYRGKGLGIGGTENDWRRSWEDVAHQFIGWKERISHALDWESALLLLLDWANVSEAALLEYAKKIEDDICYNHVLQHIIENLTRLDDLATAHKYTLLFRPTNIFKESDNLWQGYRIIARHHATRGDTENFFKLFKLCSPGDEKYEMGLLKAALVKGVCRRDGIAAAVKLCAHKNIGANYYWHALDVFAEAGEYARLKEIFAAEPQLRQPEKETELNILAKALLEARGKGAGVVDDDFEALFQRALAVSPKLKWGDVKLRDSILMDLGLAWRDDKEKRLRCRRAIKHNALKKELAA